jgi:hypothetical protein
MDTAKFLTDLRAQRDRIDNAITALEAISDNIAAPTKKAAQAPASANATGTAVLPKKRVLSPEGRQAIIEATRKRWAKKKRAEKAAAKKAAVTPTAVKPATASVKKVGKPMSEATKKKLALAAKARWAAKKTAAKTPAAKKAVTA